jgi:hypothetical protein
MTSGSSLGIAIARDTGGANMAAIKATAKRAALNFIVSSPSQIGADHSKKWVGHNHTLFDADSKARASALQEEDNGMAQGHCPYMATINAAGLFRVPLRIPFDERCLARGAFHGDVDHEHR